MNFRILIFIILIISKIKYKNNLFLIMPNLNRILRTIFDVKNIIYQSYNLYIIYLIA